MVVVNPRLTLVMGPARSGKSRWAEHLAASFQAPVAYLATGANDPHDVVWQARLLEHQRRRPSSWQTLEVGFDLAPHLLRLPPDHVALVDSLGTWVAWGLDLGDSDWEGCCVALVDSLQRSAAQKVLVSEQAGWGVVPPTAIGGLFRDRLGALEQRLMPMATAAWLVVAGRAINLHSISVAGPR